MLIMQVGDLVPVRERVEQLEIRVVHDAPPERVHGVTAAAIHLHPGDTGGAIMSFDEMDPNDGWAWAGRSWRRHVHNDVVDHIVGVEFTSADPHRLAERFGRLVDRPTTVDLTVELDSGRVTVVGGPAGRPDRLSAIELRTADEALVGTTLNIAGTDIRLVEE